PKLERELDYANSFSKSAQEAHQEAHSKIISTKILKKEQVLLLFNKAADFSYDTYYCVTKLRFLNNLPMIIESNYFPLPKMEKVLSFNQQISLFDNLKGTYPISQIHFIDGSMSVDNPSLDICDQLNISSMTPVIYVNQNALDEKGELLYFGRQIISGTSYIFKIPEQIVNL